jgi:hypothetical protein
MQDRGISGLASLSDRRWEPGDFLLLSPRCFISRGSIGFFGFDADDSGHCEPWSFGGFCVLAVASGKLGERNVRLCESSASASESLGDAS